VKRFRRISSAFTLVEVLVSVTVLALMMAIVAELMTSTQDTITRANAHVREFQEARRVLDSMSNALSQATMDAVWAYRYSPTDTTAITGYDRVSDHHFISGPASDLLPDDVTPETGQAVFFQAPLGNAGEASRRRLHDLVNCCGYYVAYGSDLVDRPGFLKTGAPARANPERKRFRLMQYLQRAEASILYADATLFGLNRLTEQAEALQWYRNDLAASSEVLADNILALVLTPFALTRNTDGTTTEAADPGYGYDSRDFQWNGLNATNQTRCHQLPVKMGITLIAADERSYDTLVQKRGEDAAAAAVRSVLINRFKVHSKLNEDLAEVEKGLGALPLHHKVLAATVALRSSH